MKSLILMQYGNFNKRKDTFWWWWWWWRFKKIKIIRFDLNLIKVDSNNNRLMLGKGESRRLLIRRRGEEEEQDAYNSTLSSGVRDGGGVSAQNRIHPRPSRRSTDAQTVVKIYRSFLCSARSVPSCPVLSCLCAHKNSTCQEEEESLNTFST